MSESEVELRKEDKLDKVKEVIKNHWKPFTVGAVLTTATFVVARQLGMRYFPTNSVRINKMTIKDSVLYFTTYERKQGPPSYVVRCIETGQVFQSQADACRQLGINPARLSRHLNNHPGYESILGHTWDRAAIAAPASG